MLTFLVVLLRILINPLSNVFQKKICSFGQSPFVANAMTYCLLSLAMVFFARKVSWLDFQGIFWFYSVLIGLFGALGNGFLVKAVQSGQLSVLGPINAWKSIVGMIFAVFLLHEIPGFVGLLGVLLILAGSYFVVGYDAPKENFSWKILQRPEYAYRIAAMVFAAIEAVFIKKIILLSNPNIAFFVWCFSGALFSLLLLPFHEEINGKKEFQAARSNLFMYFGLVVSVGLMQWATNYCFEKLPVGYALALFQLSALLSVFYGWFFFAEPHILKKMLASTIMILGSLLIILS